MQLLELPPAGVVFGVTTGKASSLLNIDGVEHVFAEVQIDGCDNRIFARIDPSGGRVSSGSTVVLAQRRYGSTHPVQNLVFMADQTAFPIQS